MNFYIRGIITSAIEAGQEDGKKELAREQYRSAKAMEQLVASYKERAKDSEDRRVAALVARVDTMCNSLEAQKEEFLRNYKEFERVIRVMTHRSALHEKQGKDWAAQLAALKKDADEERAQAEKAARDSDKKHRACVVLRDQVQTLVKSLADEREARDNIGKQWHKDVEIMQTQLQKEVAARIAAEERLHEANDANRMREREEEDTAASKEDDENSKCAQCHARNELVNELRSAVSLLNDQLSSVYREKAAGDKEKDRQHIKALVAVKEDMTEQLSAARDGQAFAEKVAKRLEEELLKHSKAIVQQQQQASRQQAPGLKRRMGGGKQQEFKDFRADIERLTGGGKPKVGSSGAGAHRPRETQEQELGGHPHIHIPHTQLPAMHPAHAPSFPSGLGRPCSSCPTSNTSVSGAGGGAAPEPRLGEIRKPTPPIGGAGGRGRTRPNACTPLNLNSVEGGSGGGSVEAIATDRGGVTGGPRRGLMGSARHLLPSKGSYTAR